MRIAKATAGRRLIPAHAGKTPDALPRVRSRAAHPRSRGENHEGTEIRGACVGSSPLTRGKHNRRTHRRAHPRLIPAHAGKTGSWQALSVSSRAHPRSRGENTADDALTAQPSGSSPLTRGKRHFQPLNNLALRLIPAHAGKTGKAAAAYFHTAAHPRSRGENRLGGGGVRFQPGSSPLTRGKLVGTCHVGPSTGLIPAHAGKTVRASGLAL